MVNNGPERLAKVAERTSQTAIAKRLTVSRPYISQIITRKRQPSLNVAARIQREYRIPAVSFAEVA